MIYAQYLYINTEHDEAARDFRHLLWRNCGFARRELVVSCRQFGAVCRFTWTS